MCFAEVPVDQLGEAEYDRLSTELIKLNRLLERAQARFSAQHQDGVERAAFLLLVHLVRTGPQRLSALAEAVHSDVSTVSRQVTQLVRLGLVARRPDPGDGRASLLAATDAGAESYEARIRLRNRNMAGVLAGWTDDDRRGFVELLARFNADYAEFHLGEAATRRSGPTPSR
jgi:DNA-binding MarR family transcriptional regulator